MKRLSEHADEYLDIYRIVGEIDAAISVASFRESLPWYCLPEFENARRMHMEDLYHPLIRKPVENSLDLEKGCLITGSNASGKSTFIKAAALNAVLAQSINTCAARSFCMPPAQVITSMAVKDDLAAGESYFIREIRYLKRIRASRAILEYLADKNCIALVASHDKELTELLKEQYENYHFSEVIGEEDIYFSYKIQKGPATSQNAVKLLELTGFPEKIIRAALR